MKYGVQAIFDHFTQRTDFTFCFIFNVFGSNTSQSFCNVTVCRVFLGDFEEVSDFVEFFMNVSLVYLGNSALLLFLLVVVIYTSRKNYTSGKHSHLKVKTIHQELWHTQNLIFQTCATSPADGECHVAFSRRAFAT